MLTLLEQVQQQGYLNVLSINGPTTYYEDPFGYTGFEYELAHTFAENLNVELIVHDVQRMNSLPALVGSPIGHYCRCWSYC